MSADSKKETFIVKATGWARREPDILGLLLVGSHANGAARDDSDVDLQVLVSNPEAWVRSRGWLTEFGKVSSAVREEWGVVRTLRVFFEGGLEVEFNFATLAWLKTDPIDPGTLRVVSDGAKILYGPSGKLEALMSCAQG